MAQEMTDSYWTARNLTPFNSLPVADGDSLEPVLRESEQVHMAMARLPPDSGQFTGTRTLWPAQHWHWPLLETAGLQSETFSPIDLG